MTKAQSMSSASVRLLQQLRERFDDVIYIDSLDLFEIGGAVRLTIQDVAELLAARCPLESGSDGLGN